MDENLRYPIGRFAAPPSFGPDDRQEWIRAIGSFPDELEEAVQDLDDEQLDTAYRPGGWTVRQVVHHVFDSHANAYVRFRLALTEQSPRIKPYDEAAWAELADAHFAPIEPSLRALKGLHDRWVRLLISMGEDDWSKAYNHPDGGLTPLSRAAALYAWHGRHHIAHITSLAERAEW